MQFANPALASVMQSRVARDAYQKVGLDVMVAPREGIHSLVIFVVARPPAQALLMKTCNWATSLQIVSMILCSPLFSKLTLISETCIKCRVRLAVPFASFLRS